VIKKYFEKFWKDAKTLRKKQIVSLVEKKQSATLLDCGCDDGTFTRVVSRAVGTKNLYGIEILRQTAQKALKKGIKVKISDLNLRFPFKDSIFDLIISDQVIEHLHDLDNFVSELNRVLKKNGYIVISTENLASWHNVFALALGIQPFSGPTLSNKKVLGLNPLSPDFETIDKRYKYTRKMPTHTKVVTLMALKRMFEAYGLRVEKIKVAGYFPLPLPLSRAFSFLDKNHSFFITLKARKI